MKKILCFIGAALFASSGMSQNAWIDAHRLASYVAPANFFAPESDEAKTIILQTLDQYGYPRSGQQGNPFLDPMMAQGGLSSAESTQVPLAGGFSSLNPFGGLSATNIAGGLADFLVERAQAELTVSFFQKMQNALANVPELTTLFPETAKLLSNLDAAQAMNLVPTLRPAFRDDLETLTQHVPDLASMQVAANAKPKAKERAVAIEKFFHSKDGLVIWALCDVFNGIVDGDDLEVALAAIYQDPMFMAAEDSVLSNGVNLIKLADFLVRGTTSGRGLNWQNLVTNATLRKVYLGLLWSDANQHNIRFKVGQNVVYLKNVIEDLDKNPADIPALFASWQGMGDNGRKLVSDMRKQNTADDTQRLSAAIPYAQHLTNLFESLEKTLVKLQVVKPAQQLSEDARSFMSEIRDDISQASHTMALLPAITAQDFQEVVYHAFQLLDGMDLQSNHILTYARLMAAVLTAQSSDEAKQAIEAIALPPGSASVKRASACNISLNAYIGPFYGREYSTTAGTDPSSITGISAPVGLAISSGKWDKKQKIIAGGTLFFSVIDVGALTAYRLENTDAEDLPELSFQNLLAPGASLYLNIRNTPFSVGGGGQFGPALREISSTGTGTSSAVLTGGKRWHVAILVDIPLLNFFTKP
ncbi:MAG: hypothetical protein H6585_07180 [Flavobacteriales bacterium]|nr:hypothetical protein [Flavobacteriales bacterium]MCB9448109.1 hypothetical protein [Flavobacteriales bacterium]